MDTIKFVDTTIRDGHQSLWAENMTTGMMLPIAKNLDDAGFEGIELISGSHLKKSVRDLKEDPWERVRLVAKLITKTPLRLIAGRVNTFEYNPPSMYRLFVERMFANGIKEARISDEWNDYEGWKFRVGECHRAGMKSILNLIYSVSPKHSDEYFALRTRQAASLNPYRLCLKDPGGLLTPERMETLGADHLEERQWDSKSSCTPTAPPASGRCAASRLWSWASDRSTPRYRRWPTTRRIRRCSMSPRTPALWLCRTDIDEEVLQPVSRHFTAIAKREGFTIGAPVEYDYSQYQHQVPGGMLSNLRFQLRKVGLEHRFPEALEETIKVREEFGYPIMVTPLSQFVGSQAAINVIVGERYKEVTDQVIKFALGHAGAEGARDMAANVKDKILDRPRAKEWAKWTPDEPSPDEIRRNIGAEGTSDEELLLRWIIGKEDIDFMRANKRPLEYLNSEQPLVNLLQELSKRTKNRQIHVQTANFSVTMERRA